MSEPFPDAPVAGRCDAPFEGVRRAFEANLASGRDVGASMAIWRAGEMVVDLWGGWRDEARREPWEPDTIVNVFSSTKTPMALCALLLADRGDLDVDAPVRRYWPEFSDPRVTTRHCLAHTAGIPGWDEPLEVPDLYDWEACTSALARQTPWWAPGTAWGYHALTQGYLVGEVVRRIAGQSLGLFLAQELCGPLDADFHIGLAPSEDSRVAPVIPAPPAPPVVIEGDSVLAKMSRPNPNFTQSLALDLPYRRAEIPAGNGFGNARSLARLMSVLAGGGIVDGRRLMTEAGCLAALSESWNGRDVADTTDIAFGLGFCLKAGPFAYGRRACFWGGNGGSYVIVDFDRRMTFAYAMNRLQGAPFGDPRNVALVRATYAALEQTA